MKRFALLIIVFFFFMGLSGCKNQELANQWKPENLKIDGSDADWQDVPLFMEEDLNITVGSVNDRENEYLILKTGDQRLIRRVQRMGLTIWLSEDGKKDKKFGIRYVGSESLAENLRRERDFGDEQSGQQPRRDSRMRNIRRTDLPEPGMLGIIQNGKCHMEPEKNPWGPSAASGENGGLFCYEFKIPLQFAQSVTDDSEMKKFDKIKIGIEIGGITKEMRDSMRKNMAGTRDRGMGGGGMRGGMGRGGRGMGERGGMMRPGGGQQSGKSDLENKEFWFDLFLSEK